MRGANPAAELDATVARATSFAPGELVLVACSGGPDSVALAAVLDRSARAHGFELALAHVNHATRPSAWQDECVVLSVGARLGRRVVVRALDGAAVDEAGLRAGRYAALDAVAASLGATTVATGHTAEDQTETVLLALFRGTGLDGLAGMPAVRTSAAGLRIVRPFLRVTHADAYAELRRSGLPYALDPSNADPRYRRGAVRDALAGLRAEFPQLDRAVARCAEIVRDESERPERADARRRLREQLRAAGELRDVSFERLEAVLDAGDGARVHLKTGVHAELGDRRGR